MRGDIQAAVFDILQKNAGSRITLDDVVVHTNYNRRQIQSAISTIIREGKWPVATIVRGRIWSIGLNTEPRLNPRSITEITLPEPGPVTAEDEQRVYPFMARPGPDDEQIARAAAYADEQMLSRNRAPALAPQVHHSATRPAPQPTRPAPQDDTRVYEWMGNRPDGTVLLRDDLGDWHIFKEIEKL